MNQKNTATEITSTPTKIQAGLLHGWLANKTQSGSSSLRTDTGKQSLPRKSKTHNPIMLHPQAFCSRVLAVEGPEDLQVQYVTLGNPHPVFHIQASRPYPSPYPNPAARLTMWSILNGATNHGASFLKVTKTGRSLNGSDTCWSPAVVVSGARNRGELRIPGDRLLCSDGGRPGLTGPLLSPPGSQTEQVGSPELPRRGRCPFPNRPVSSERIPLMGGGCFRRRDAALPLTRACSPLAVGLRVTSRGPHSSSSIPAM